MVTTDSSRISSRIHLDLFAALAAPFGAREVKSRPQGGRQLAYITARTVMNRLDTVLGPASWHDDYSPLENSVICRLTIVLPDGSAVTKCDAGGHAGMADSGDDDKSAFSDAFKRAAVKFGVGRELYGDGVADLRGGETALREDHGLLRENATIAMAPATANGRAGNGDPGRSNGNGHANGNGNGRSIGHADGAPVPRTGAAMYRWVKDREEEHGVGLLKYLNGWGKLQADFPGRIVDWDAHQVEAGHREATRKIEGLQAARH
jgi:hypothetical protein